MTDKQKEIVMNVLRDCFYEVVLKSPDCYKDYMNAISIILKEMGYGGTARTWYTLFKRELGLVEVPW